MYAIVRAGGRPEKVAVGDVVQIDKVSGEPGSSITLPALLVVDGETVTSDPKKLAGVTVTAEVLGGTKGPKITIMKFKNKTGYRKRQGHRSELTRLEVTDIKMLARKPAASGTKTAAKPAAKKEASDGS